MNVPKLTLFDASVARRFSSLKLPKFRCVNEVPQRYKPLVVDESQKAIREYLHATNSLPYAFAELIAKNSPFSLSNLIRNIHFSARSFSRTLRKLLRYEPINEFEFFLESIGIDYRNVHRFLPRNKFFLAEDRTFIDSAFALCRFGFPWNTLGKLYEEEASIFRKSPDELTVLLLAFKEYFGFENLPVVGICLAFPHLLSLEGESDLGDDVQAIFDDMRRLYVGLDWGSCFEGNVDDWYEVCCKVRVFYELGCQKGKVGGLMCENKKVFLRCPREVLVQKADYFGKFGVGNVDVGMLLVLSPQILDLDLETPIVSVLRVLEHFGLDENELQRVSLKYSHVMGRNEMANLPSSMRALDLNEWFFDKVKSSGARLLATCAISCPEEDLDKVFVDAMKSIKSLRCTGPPIRKLEFLKSIGFGENGTTIQVLKYVKGTSVGLAKRFDCFLNIGIEYSRLCMLIRMKPQILTQSPENLEQKLNFLCGEMRSSLEYLDRFPGFVCFNLDRIKCRYRFFVWLGERALLKKDYSIGTLISTAEKDFITRLFGIHRAIPKQYLECFINKRFSDDNFQG